LPSSESVTTWLAELKTGNPEAAQKLWERYFHRLVGLARAKLQATSRRAADEEDVALSAFHSFCQGAEQGRFPQLQDRNNLWPLLVVITARKALDLVAHNRSQKQGGGRARGESALFGEAGCLENEIEKIISPEPSPEFAAEVADEYERLL
jgi:hypothetical protein